MEYKIDKKLDNNRVSINATLIKISYILGDKKLTIKKHKYNKRSGYCLDNVKENEESVNLEDIGKLSVRNWIQINTNIRWEEWEIYCYPDKQEKANKLITKSLKAKRQVLLDLANSIPTK